MRRWWGPVHLMMALSSHPDRMCCVFCYLISHLGWQWMFERPSSRLKLKFTARRHLTSLAFGLGQLFEDFTQILFHNQIIDLNAASNGCSGRALNKFISFQLSLSSAELLIQSNLKRIALQCCIFYFILAKKRNRGLRGLSTSLSLGP